MYGRFPLLLLCLLTVLLGACQSQSGIPATVEQLQADRDALESRLEAVETRLATLEASEPAANGEGSAADEADVFDVVVATYLMDTAGFHGMDEAINGEGIIDPGYPATVRRVYRLITGTVWPEELRESALGFSATLEAFAEALEADDLEAAKPLATQVHDEQHGFSHAVEGWLAEQGIGGSAGDHD